MLEDYLNIAVRAIFVENMALTFFLGMCSFLAVSKRVSTAVGLGAAVVFVLTVTVPLNHAINDFLLRPGALGRLHPALAGLRIHEQHACTRIFKDISGFWRGQMEIHRYDRSAANQTAQIRQRCFHRVLREYRNASRRPQIERIQPIGNAVQRIIQCQPIEGAALIPHRYFLGPLGRQRFRKCGQCVLLSI